MYIEIEAEIEIYKNNGELLVRTEDKEEKVFKTKRFLKSKEQIEKEVEKYIEKILATQFNAAMVEANKSLYSSLIYHLPLDDSHKMMFVRVEHNGKKVEFPDYYLPQLNIA